MIVAEQERSTLGITSTETHIHVLPLPRECVIDVEVNPTARACLPKDGQYLLDTDILRNFAFFSIPRDKYEWQKRKDLPLLHVFQDEGRAFGIIGHTIAYGPGFLGRYVTSKGIGLSGIKYKEHTTYSTQSDLSPLGFYGGKSARDDMRRSMLLLKHSFRASLPLALLLLDSAKLKTFIEKEYHSRPKLIEQVLRYLDVVARNNDTPAQYLRLSGTRGRIASLHYFSQANRLTYDPSLAGQLFLGLQNLAWEFRSYPERFRDVFELISASPSETQMLLDTSGYSKRVISVSRLIPLTTALVAVEYKRMLRETEPVQQEFLSYVYNTAARIGKDIDLSFLHADFEYNTIKNVGTPTQADFTSLMERLITQLMTEYSDFLSATHPHINNPWNEVRITSVVSDILSRIDSTRIPSGPTPLPASAAFD